MFYYAICTVLFLKALFDFKAKRTHNLRNAFVFRMYKMRSLKSSKCWKAEWNSLEQPIKSTQNLQQREQHQTHKIVMLLLLLLCCSYWKSLMVWHTTSWMKALKVSCSKAACSSSMRLIFHKNHNMTAYKVKI